MPPADKSLHVPWTLPRLWISLQTYFFRLCASYGIHISTRFKGFVIRLVLLAVWHTLEEQANSIKSMDPMQNSMVAALGNTFSISNSTLEPWELRNPRSDASFTLKMMQWNHPKAPPYLITSMEIEQQHTHISTGKFRWTGNLGEKNCIFFLDHSTVPTDIQYEYWVHTTHDIRATQRSALDSPYRQHEGMHPWHHYLSAVLNSYQRATPGSTIIESCPTEYQRKYHIGGDTSSLYRLAADETNNRIWRDSITAYLPPIDYHSHRDSALYCSNCDLIKISKMADWDNNMSDLIQTFLTVYAPIPETPYLLLSCLPATSSEILGLILMDAIARSHIAFDTTSVQRLLTDPILKMNVLGTDVREAIGAERASSTHFAFPLLQRTPSSPWFLTALTIEGSLGTLQNEFLAAQSSKSSKALRSKGHAAARSASTEPAKANPSNGKASSQESFSSPNPKGRETRIPRYDDHLKSRSRFTALLQGDHPPTTPPILMPIRCEIYHQLAEGHTQIPVGWLLGYHKAKDSRADTLLRGLRGLQHAINTTTMVELSWCPDHLGTPPDCPPSYIHRILSRMLTLEWVHSLNPASPTEKADNLRVALQGPKSLIRMVDLFMTMLMRRLAPDSLESHTGTLEGTSVHLMGLQFYFQRIAPQGKQALVQIMKAKVIADMEQIYKPACRMKFTERICGLRGDIGIEAFLHCLCGFDSNLAGQISVVGCLDMRIAADASIETTLSGYFIEFTLPIYKLVAARIFHSPQFGKFSALYQLAGTISERSRGRIANVIPLSSTCAWTYGDDDNFPNTERGVMDTQPDPDLALDPELSELYAPDIRASEDTLIIQAKCLPLWREQDFNGWCLLAAACLIRGISTTVYDYSPLQLYNGVSAILAQFSFLLISEGEEARMLRAKELLSLLKKSMETTLRRDGAHMWPALPLSTSGAISLTTFANLTQHRVGGFLGVLEIVSPELIEAQDFEYRYFSLKPGAILTVDQILNPCQQLVTGQQPLPILCQVNQHFQLLTPREASTARALKQMLHNCPSQVCRPATWPEMNAMFGMLPKTLPDPTSGTTRGDTPMIQRRWSNGEEAAAQGSSPGPAQASPPYYGSAAWALDYLRNSRHSPSISQNSTEHIDREDDLNPIPVQTPRGTPGQQPQLRDKLAVQKSSEPAQKMSPSAEVQTSIPPSNALLQNYTNARYTDAHRRPFYRTARDANRRRGPAAAREDPEPAHAQPVPDDAASGDSAHFHDLVLQRPLTIQSPSPGSAADADLPPSQSPVVSLSPTQRDLYQTSPTLLGPVYRHNATISMHSRTVQPHPDHDGPYSEENGTAVPHKHHHSYWDGANPQPMATDTDARAHAGDGNLSPQGFLVKLYPPSDSDWPQKERDIMTLMGEAKFRPPKIPIDAPYPHPSFHYQEVPAAMVDLRQTFDSYPTIVEEIARIPKSKLQWVRRDPNRQMVEVGEYPDSGVALKTLPMLSYFLIGARHNLIKMKLIHPMARWRIVLLLPSKHGGLADVQLPHTDEAWEVFPTDADREKCRRTFSRNDSIIIGLGNGPQDDTDTILDFAKGITHQMHKTDVSNRLDIKVTRTVRFHLRPGQAVLFSSAAVHMGPAEVQGGSYRVFIQSISPSWPSVYLPRRNYAPRAYVLAFDMYPDPPSEHWFLTSQGRINKISHSIWSEQWVQFLPRADYDSAFHSPLSIEINRNSLIHLLSDARVSKNQSWGAHPTSSIANSPLFPYTIHPGMPLDDVGEFVDDFGALAVAEEPELADPDALDPDLGTDIDVASTQEATPEDPEIDAETAQDILTELLSSPETLRSQDVLQDHLAPLCGLGKRKRRERARKIRNAKKFRHNAVNFATYSPEQRALITAQRDSPRLRLTDTKLGKVVAPALGKSYAPGELIWFVPSGLPGNSSLISVPDPRDPTDMCLIRARHSKYEYGLMTSREQVRQTFRPRHRDPAAYLWATGDPSRANCYFDLSALPFRIIASKWILAEEPIIYHDNREPVNYVGISRYCDFSDADVDEIISSHTTPFRPPFIRADGITPQWEDYVSTVCRQTTFPTISALLQKLQEFAEPILSLRLTVDYTAITTFPSLDGLNLLRHAFSLCTKQALPSPINANLDYNLPAGREHLIRALLYFGRDYYFQQRDTPISDALIEALLLRCCNLGKMLRTISHNTPFENPFTHTDIIVLLTASHAPPNEIYVGGPNVFTHNSSSKAQIAQYVYWKGFSKWYGTCLGERLIVTHDPEKGCYWLNMVYWQQLRLAAMRWFDESIKGALNRSKTMQHKLFARFATAEQILKELKLSKGYPSNYAGDGPHPWIRNPVVPTHLTDPKTGCKIALEADCTTTLWEFAQAHQYHIVTHTIIEWMLSTGPDAFQFSFQIPTGTSHTKYYHDNPGDGFCGIWVLLRSVYIKCTENEPPFHLIRDGLGGTALNLLLHKLITTITSRDDIEERVTCLHCKLVYIWTRLQDAGMTVDPHLWAVAAADAATMDFSPITNQHAPEYLELEELDVAMQLLHLRYVIWVPAHEGVITYNSDYLAIGSYHPFGMYSPGPLVESTGPASLRCLIQTLLNQDNIHVAYNRQHYYMIADSAAILSGLLSVCVQLISTLHDAFASQISLDASPGGKHTTHLDMDFATMYLKHMLLGGHPGIIPAMSELIPQERGLHRQTGTCFRLNSPMTRYSPRRLDYAAATSLVLDTDTTSSDYAVSHPDDDLYIADGRPYINDGFLGSLTNDLLGPTKHSYNASVRFTVHPREGLQTWTIAPRTLSRAATRSELSFDYGQAYWMDRMTAPNGGLVGVILTKYNPLKYVPSKPIRAPPTWTMEQIFDQVHMEHFLDNPTHYTTHGDAHWTLLQKFNCIPRTQALSLTPTGIDNVKQAVGLSTPDDYQQPYSIRNSTEMEHTTPLPATQTITAQTDHGGCGKDTTIIFTNQEPHSREAPIPLPEEILLSLPTMNNCSLEISKVNLPHLITSAPLMSLGTWEPPQIIAEQSGLLHSLQRRFPSAYTPGWLFEPRSLQWGLHHNSPLSTSEREQLQKRLHGAILPPLGHMPLYATTKQGHFHSPAHLDDEVIQWYQQEARIPRLIVLPHFKSKQGKTSWILTLRKNAQIRAGETILIPSGLRTTKQRGSHIHQCGDAFLDTKKCSHDYGLMGTFQEACPPNPVNYIRYANPLHPSEEANARWDCTLQDFPKLIATRDILEDGTHKAYILLASEGSFRPSPQLLFHPGNIGLPLACKRVKKAIKQTWPTPVDLPPQTGHYNAQAHRRLQEPTVPFRFRRSDNYAGLGSLNINGKYNEALIFHEVFKLMTEERLLGFAFLDTRLPQSSTRVHRQILARIFGPGAIIIPYPGRGPTDPSGLSERDKLVGGITLLFMPTPGVRILHCLIDPHRLGIWVKVSMKIGCNSLTWIPCYIPHHSSEHNLSPNSGALHAKLANCLQYSGLQTDGSVESPMEWIFRKLAALMAGVYGTSDDHAILQGDLNLSYDKQDLAPHSLINTFQDMGLNFHHRECLEEYHISPLTFMQTYKDISDIDHCLCTASKHNIVAGGVGHHLSWGIIGLDHRPVWIGIRLTTPVSHLSMTLRRLPMVQLQSTETSKTKYKDNALAWFDRCVGRDDDNSKNFSFNELSTPAQAEAQLEYLVYSIAHHFSLTYSKDAGTRTSTKPRRSRPGEHLEDPETVEVTLMLAFYHDVHRLIKEDVKNPLDVQLQEEDMHFIAQEYAMDIEALYARTDSTCDERTPTRRHDADVGRTLLNFWISATKHEAILALTPDYEAMRHKSHGKYRTYKRLRINEHVLKREELAAQMKLKKVIKSFLGTSTDPWSFDVIETEVRNPEGVPILETRPEHIHNILSHQAVKMFADQPDSIPCKLNVAMENSYDNWTTLLDQPAKLQSLLATAAPAIPSAARAHIADSICNKPQRHAIHAELTAHFDKKFSFTYFTKLIAQRDNNSSPGMSGLTIGMLKYIPHKLLHTLFRLLSLLWRANRIPAHWKIKWLHCIPKKDETISNITMLRPLGMLEILRKLWTLMIVKPIKKAAIKHKAIDNSQMAFLPNVGTDSELTVINNVLNEAKKLNLGIDMLSWDIAKAFDSVHRMIQFLVWLRMGVPQKVAELLIELDNNGTFILKSPYAQDQVAGMQLMPAQERYDAQYKLGFRAGRGYTQGDVLSTLGWVFLFDIVFTAVKHTRPDLHLRIRGIGSSLYTSGVVGFADDFITITIPELTPHFATATSAAYAILGLASAVHKFRAVSSHALPDRTISVYDHNWNGSVIKFADEAHCIKVLGILINLNLDWTPQYLSAKETFTHAIRLLKSKRGSLATKIKILKMAIIPKLLYPITKIGLTEAQLKSLTSTCDELYTHRHIERTFPKFLLHSRFAPLQTPDVGNITLTNQFNSLMRVQNEPKGSPGHLAASGIIMEAVRCSMLDDPSITGCDLNTDPRTFQYGRNNAHNTHSITELMQQLGRHDVALHIKGFQGAPDPLHIRLSKMDIHLNDDARGILAAAEITYINELIEASSESETDSRCWIPAGWILKVQQIFGYNDSNLVECVREYILQYSHHYHRESLPCCCLSQGQILKLRTSRLGQHVYFDCAGINITTRLAEGCLYDAPLNRDGEITFKPVALRLIAGGTRLGVTGNYSISTTELRERYEGRAIAVDITKRMGGPSEYRLLHIHHIRIDFCTHYLQSRLTPSWNNLVPPGYQTPSTICSAGHCTTMTTDPLTLFNTSGKPCKEATGVLIFDNGPSGSLPAAPSLGLRCDFTSIPNITTTGADSLIGAVLMNFSPRAEITRISAGPGASARLNQRRYRRGHINLPFGMLMRRGSKDGVSPKIRWISGRRGSSDPLIPNHDRRLAGAARKIVQNLTLSPADGMAKEVLHIPCLDLFSGLFHTGEFYCSLKGAPIIGNPFNELDMDLGNLQKYLHKRVHTYKSSHAWTEDTFGLYPHISKLMLQDPFNRRKAYCRQMFDHIYCNTVKVARSMIPDTQSTCLCCTTTQDEDPYHVLYCSSHPRTIYRQHVLAQMTLVSQGYTDGYTQKFTKYLLHLLFFEDIGNKRNLWMGRPSIKQLQMIRANMDPRLPWPEPKKFLVSMAHWYYSLIKHGLGLWHIRNIEMHMPALDSEASDLSSVDTVSSSSHSELALDTITIDDLLRLLDTYKTRRRNHTAKQKANSMQAPLSFAHSKRPPVLLNEIVLSPQSEVALSQISDITNDAFEDSSPVSRHCPNSHVIAEITTFPAGQDVNPPPHNDNYRHIVERTCNGYDCANARRVLQGDTSIIVFPNEPTISHEHLLSLREGKSVHSVIMSSFLTLLQWHFNPRGQPENILFVYYAFLQQLLTGTRTMRSLTKQFFALSHSKDLSTIRSCFLLVHVTNVPGGHWTFIYISLGDTVSVSYHDSIQALAFNFDQFIQPITDFLRGLNISGKIEFSVAPNPQQMDGHSCGVYALAGMLALAHGNTHWTLPANQTACMRQDVCQSIIDVTLITHHSLHDASHIPEALNVVEPKETVPNSKRKHFTQGLITDSFKRYRESTSVGQQGLKRTPPPIEDPPSKRARQDAIRNDTTRIQKPLQTGTPRKTNKKERLKNAIFSKLCN